MNFGKISEVFEIIESKINSLPPQQFKNIFLWSQFLLQQQGKYKLFQDKQKWANSMQNEVPISFLETSNHYLKQTTAAYGKLGLSMVYDSMTIASSSFRLASDKMLIARHVGINKDDVIEYQLDPKHKDEDLSHPKYFIALDKKQKNIVLSIRGTFEYNDILTDLCGNVVDFEYMDVEGCKTHEGIQAGVKQLYETISQTLKKCILRFPDQKLILTGHSLGGGSSCLMYLFLKTKVFQGKFPDINISCFAFAPPPVFQPAEAILPDHSKNIFVFVNENDIVPRLSVQELVDLTKMMRKADASMINISIKQMYIHRNYKRYMYTKYGLSTIQDYASNKYKDFNNNYNQIKESIESKVTQISDKLSYFKNRSSDQLKSFYTQKSNEEKQEENDYIVIPISEDQTENELNEQNYNEALLNLKQKSIKDESNIDLIDKVNENEHKYQKSLNLNKKSQLKELNELENQEIDQSNSNLNEFENIQTNDSKSSYSFYDDYVHVEKELQFLQKILTKERLEIGINDGLIALNQIGNVQWIFEDTIEKKQQIRNVYSTAFQEILFHPNSTANHMSRDYELRFRQILGLEQQTIRTSISEIEKQNNDQNMINIKNIQ